MANGKFRCRMDQKSPEAPTSVLRLLASRLRALLWWRHRVYAAPILPPELAQGRRSVFLRHLDCGSCNGCELELTALSNPIYDSERYGIRFEASPRHADALVLTGSFTLNLKEAAELTLAAMPEPRIVTIGDCTCAQDSPDETNIFRPSYAVIGMPESLRRRIVPNGHVPGCPPTPEAILKALAAVDWSVKPGAD